MKDTATGKILTKNGEKTQESINLTEKCLIPGLEACSAFSTATRVQLSEHEKRGQEDAKKRYFKLMKKHAETLDNNYNISHKLL